MLVSRLYIEYIPRESNVFGDFAAGLASASLLAREVEQADQEPTFTNNCADLPLPLFKNDRISIPASGCELLLSEHASVEPYL